MLWHSRAGEGSCQLCLSCDIAVILPLSTVKCDVIHGAQIRIHPLFIRSRLDTDTMIASSQGLLNSRLLSNTRTGGACHLFVWAPGLDKPYASGVPPLSPPGPVDDRDVRAARQGGMLPQAVPPSHFSVKHFQHSRSLTDRNGTGSRDRQLVSFFYF